jgi:NAD(P)-dependent dehydrogenase (short-subunit alcohol dehydrogenase family)
LDRESIVLVTGATGGIGRETCHRLAERGTRVVLADLADTAEVGQALADEIGKGAEFHPLDVTSPEDWQRLEQHVAREHGLLDGLVNNAGVILMKPIAETTLEDWNRVNAINSGGVFLGTKTLLTLLSAGARSSEFGSAVVNLSSVYGIGGQPFFAAYSASKGAVRLFSKTAALEFAALGLRVRVNSVHPGPIDTPLARGPLEAAVAAGQLPSVEEGLAGMASIYPSGRLGVPADVAGAILFLLSDEARFVNGTELTVDDGLTAKAH